MTDLLLVHGRAQQDKDADDLKAEWISALERGLGATGLRLPVEHDAIRFPFYGDTLRDMATKQATTAEVIVRGAGVSEEERAFLRAVLEEVRAQVGITDEQIDAEYEKADVVDRAPQNWRWVRAVLRALDRHAPWTSAPSIALATRDVHLYLRTIAIRDRIESGVRAALRPGVPTVVVGHSLGSVVAYNLLRRDGEREGWTVPLYATVGSPLAVGAIRRTLRPTSHPTCVTRWYNAMDPRDLVALHPLDDTHFPVEPAIENKIDVDNDTANRHGISGYLGDPDVARTIYLALTGSAHLPAARAMPNRDDRAAP